MSNLPDEVFDLFVRLLPLTKCHLRRLGASLVVAAAGSYAIYGIRSIRLTPL